MATESTSQSMLLEISSLEARFHPRMEASSPRWAMRLMAAFSSPPIAGMPASICWTPISSSSLAMRTFSRLAKTMPAACSPSLRVVSQTINFLFANFARTFPLSLIFSSPISLLQPRTHKYQRILQDPRCEPYISMCQVRSPTGLANGPPFPCETTASEHQRPFCYTRNIKG